jgi:hypothetical protein
LGWGAPTVASLELFLGIIKIRRRLVSFSLPKIGKTSQTGKLREFASFPGQFHHDFMSLPAKRLQDIVVVVAIAPTGRLGICTTASQAAGKATK